MILREIIEFIKDLDSIHRGIPRHLDSRVFDTKLSIEEEAQLPDFQQVLHSVVLLHEQEGVNPRDTLPALYTEAEAIYSDPYVNN